jgi:TIGR03009 family protein
LAPSWANRIPPQDQKYLEIVLKAWETHGTKIKVFHANFTRFSYGPDWKDPAGPIKLLSQVEGELKYEKPDKGLFAVKDKNGVWDEKWICDGEAFYEYNFGQKLLRKIPLPPSMRGGRALADGPIPFVFGAKAQQMKQLYWMRPLLPPKDKPDEVWLEAWPRKRKQAADFRCAIIVLNRMDMRPIAIKRFAGNGQRIRKPDGRFAIVRESYESFVFQNTKINPIDPRKLITPNTFTPHLDRGWKLVIEQFNPGPPVAKQGRSTATPGTRLPMNQAGRPPAGQAR